MVSKEELEAQLKQYWSDTAEERKRTHTGKMYEAYMNKMEGKD